MVRLSIFIFPLLFSALTTSFAADSLSKVPVEATTPDFQPEVAKSGVEWFPNGDLFRALLADPKQQQFFMSFVRLRAKEFGLDTTGWLVGFGETIGFVRNVQKQNGWQLNLIGGLFAQFNWEAPSKDLINADYTFGATGTYRYRLFSSRIRLYHQSSHLGDEFLLNQRPERVNLSYEALDALGAVNWKAWRFYGGGGILLSHDPKDLKRGKYQYGAEFMNPSRYSFFRPVAALDVQGFDENRWRSNYSLRAGIEIGKAGVGGRRARLLAEYYKGFSPFGQFFDSRLEYYGAGIYLGF